MNEEIEKCPICLDEFTNKVRKQVNCSGCKKNICLTCTKLYILSSSVSPHCMHCKREFSNDWIDIIFSKSFRENQLRKHRIKLLMEQEKSMFPHTLTVIETDELMNECAQLINEQDSFIRSISPRETTPIDISVIHKINYVRERLKKLYERMEQKNIELKNNKSAVNTIKKCPNCKDGILNASNICYSCKNTICKHCFTLIQKDHSCKEDDILTYKMLVQETKPCPKCGTRISKVDGCNQMWCTSCNTAFNWANLQIINGRIHNPHYQEYLIRNQITNDNWRDNCENNQDPFFFPYDNAYTAFQVICENIRKNLSLQHHFRTLQVEIQSITQFLNQRSYNGAQKNIIYSVNLYEDLRKQVIKKMITEERWFSTLSARETVRERERKFSQLDELIINVGRDLFRNAFEKKYQTVEELEQNFFQPIYKTREYYNEQYIRLTKEYNIMNCKEFHNYREKPVQIDHYWRFH